MNGRRWPIALLTAAFAALGILYSVATPIFEAPDEPEHFFYARYLAQTGKLPLPEKGTLWAQEATQPPLYYALAALPIALVDTSDAEAVAQRNPHAAIGIPLYPDNKNVYIHTAQQQFPWSGTALAVHLVRFLSVLLGAVTVWMTYLLGLELGLTGAVSLGAAAVVAFVPQFGFISGAANNDNLVTALSAVALWALVRHLNRGPSAQRALVIGLLAGLASLAKLSGAGLLALCGVGFLWRAWRRKDRAWLRDAGMVLAVWLVVAGWWFARNYALYGDLTGTLRMLEMMGSRTDTPNLADIWGELRGLTGSFWGLFGWFNIPAPTPMYKIFNLLVVGAAPGWIAIVLLRRGKGIQPRMAWPILWALIIIAGLAQWTVQTPASQGRLLFPALPAIALILATGWSAVIPERLRGPILSLIPAVFLFWTARAPLWTIIPAYTAPTVLAAGALPSQLKPLDAVIGDAATLVGYWASPETTSPAGEVTVTLCWQPMRQTSVNYSVYVHLLGRGQKIVGQRDTYPGGGLLATSTWKPQDVFCDDIRIPIAPDADGPALLRMTAGLYDLGTGDRLPVFDGWGRATTIVEDVARLSGNPVSQPEHPASAIIEGEIELTGWEAAFLPDNPNQARVTLRWCALSTPTGDYTAFVHLLDADGNNVAQHDGIPVNGDYPTQWWLSGDMVEDAHLLKADSPIPPGAYMIKVGMYRTDNPEQRLSMSVDGTQVPQKQILVGPITR